MARNISNRKDPTESRSEQEREWSRTHVKTLGRYRLRDPLSGYIGGRRSLPYPGDWSENLKFPLQPDRSGRSTLQSVAHKSGVATTHPGARSEPATLAPLLPKGGLCVDSNSKASKDGRTGSFCPGDPNNTWVPCT